MRFDLTRRLMLAAIAVAALTGPAHATAASKPAAAYASGHVYLIRGLGDFWSRGIDKFKAELDALGVPNTIFNHVRSSEISAAIVKRKADKSLQPIIIIGHSYGADAGVIMSNWLGQNGIPVRLLVTFDGRNKIPPVGNSVGEVIDYFKPPFGRQTRVAADFKGPVTVTDLRGRKDITHDSIDKKDEYHQAVIAKILAIMKAK